MNEEKYDLEEYDLQKMNQMNQGAKKLLDAFWEQLKAFKEGKEADNGRDTD